MKVCPTRSAPILFLAGLAAISKGGQIPVDRPASHPELGAAGGCQDRGLERLEEVLTVIEMILDELNISPIFPYPFYIITPHETNLTSFPTIKSEKELPSFFKLENHRVTIKEQKLLDKIEVVCSQIKNENVKKRLDDYKMNVLPQKLIKSLAKEGQFLEKVLDELDKN